MKDLHRESVEAVRRALLEFHKRIIEAARIEYEKIHGRIETSGEYLRILTTDESFLWLRPFSELILALDELGGMPTATDEDAATVRLEVDRLLGDGDGGTAARYMPLLEITPDTVIALSKLQQIITRLPTPSEALEVALGRRAAWKTPRRTLNSRS